MKSLLVGTAAPLAGDPVAAQGGGLVDVGAAVAAELGFSPATLSLGVSTGLGWRATQTVTLRNLSTRRLRVRLSVQHVSEGAAAVRVAVRPGAIDLPEGLSAKVTVTASVASAPVGDGPAAGVVVAAVGPGSAVRIPWVVAFGPQTGPLLARVRLSAHSFKPSDAAPALLSFQAGRVTGGRIVPVARLDVRLSGPNGFVGLLARIRDVLPGSYAFGLTGRGPVGEILGPGMYTARLVAYPTAGGSPSVQAVRFMIR